ncbi:SGNH/GDSL hydrolase family protein [Fusobacterium simiae]|uniref:SGNH/GDSL hydrolase family protein n=1 Tax=Fusobacterium simiae TaxID=855 RepID=A0ABT4DIE7_FUSSI|nr:autotransporter outer membrane beta-barrel domain-containing protein [Fusobacterium simiae]MCY7008243.1 SGNH/GDSL hydrolase family protein [Fusobacterium simiae]
MNKKFCLIILFLLFSHLLNAEKFIVFGDSLSDTGNLARFTYNSGKIYNENLANYFGEPFPVPKGGASTLFGGAFGIKPPSLKGPNFAQGGATANTDLGMGRNFLSGSFIKFQTAKQINSFLKIKPKKENLKNYKVVYWIGGNDMRLASEVIDKYKTVEANSIINKSIQDIGKQIKQLADEGITFMIVPNVPDIAYTPKFFKQFTQTIKIDGKLLYNEKRWYRRGGIRDDEFDNLLDEPSLKTGATHDEIIKNAIKKMLEKQGEDASEEKVNKWFARYKEEREKLSRLGKHLNQGVDNELEKIKKTHPELAILRPDISSMISEVVAYPEYYGFTNASGTASKTFSSAVANIFRWGAGTGTDRIAAFEPEDNIEGKGGLDKRHLWKKGYHYVFGDEFHPSPEAHRIISDYIISLIETEDGKVYDGEVPYLGIASRNQTYLTNLKGSTSTQKYETNEEYIRGYVPYGAIRAREGAKIEWNGLKLINDGIAISSYGESSSIIVKNYYIKNTGRINAVVQAENGGNVILENGKLESKRGSRISYPFGIRINGENSKAILKNSELIMEGKNSVGISVGNLGILDLNSSIISIKGSNTKGLHIWNAKADLKNSKIEAKDGIGVWLFSNDRKNNNAFLNIENSNIIGKDYSVKISFNVTKFPVVAKISSKNSNIYGGIFTEKGNISDIYMENTSWKMGKDSFISNLALQSSQIYFSPEGKNNIFHTLTIEKDYKSNNSILYMKGKLEDDNSLTDRFVVKGDVEGQTWVDYQNTNGEGKATNYGIKIIDLAKSTDKNAFQLLNPIYVGKYEYTLLAGGNNATEAEDFYLTSNLIYKNGKAYIPTLSGNINTTSLKSLGTYAAQPTQLSLLRPKVSVKSLIPYANIESSFQNIFHLKNRESVFFATERIEKTLKEENKSKIEMKSSITKLSYPLYDKFGFFFSIDYSDIKLHDTVREYFNKDSQVGKLKTIDLNIGFYYQNYLFQKINFDHTLQYDLIQNRYKTEDISNTKYGYGVAYSSLLYTPLSLTKNWSFEPNYQIDILYYNFDNYHDYAIRNYLGGDFLWKKDQLSFQVGIRYKWDLQKIDGIKVENERLSHNYKGNSLFYKMGGEYNFSENLKLHGTINLKANGKNTSYEVGIKYKF